VTSRAINFLAQKIPNFAFVFGAISPSLLCSSMEITTKVHPFSTWNQDMCIFVELLQGKTLFQWLQETEFSNFNNILKLFNILIQVNLALQVAQNKCAFMHYDLFPWNIILLELPELATFEYHVQSTRKVSISTNLIPVIFDFGKARVVVAHERQGLSSVMLDHGFKNLFQTNKILDTLTLLTSCLQVIHKKINIEFIFKIFQPFFQLTGLSLTIEHLSNFKRFDIFKKTKLWTLKDVNVIPINFVDFLSKTKGLNLLKISNVRLDVEDPKNFIGHPIYSFFKLTHQTHEESLFKTFSFLTRTTFPKSSIPLLQEYIRKMTHTHLNWLEQQILNTSNNEKLIQDWYQFMELRDQMPSQTTIDDNVLNFHFQLPDNVKNITLHANMTENELQRLKKNRDWIVGDFSAMFDVVFDLIASTNGNEKFQHWIDNDVNIFDFLTSVAKNNMIMSLCEKN
jgi:hypothetical protein